MKTATLTHVQKISKENQTVKQQIIDLLGGTVAQYNQFQYETGIEFLEFECEGVYDDVTRIAKTELFWAWWRNQWAARDASFLLRARVFEYEDLARNYRIDNTPASVLFNTNIMQKSYANLIGSIIKKELVS